MALGSGHNDFNTIIVCVTSLVITLKSMVSKDITYNYRMCDLKSHHIYCLYSQKTLHKTSMFSKDIT